MCLVYSAGVNQSSVTFYGSISKDASVGALIHLKSLLSVHKDLVLLCSHRPSTHVIGSKISNWKEEFLFH